MSSSCPAKRKDGESFITAAGGDVSFALLACCRMTLNSDRRSKALLGSLLTDVKHPERQSSSFHLGLQLKQNLKHPFIGLLG